MSKRGRVRRFLKQTFVERIGLKIFALASSILLFSIVSGSEDAQRSLFVEVISILPPPASMKVLVSDLPDKVKVTLRGSRSLINSLERADLNAVQIDLRDTSSRYYYFDASSFEIPAGLEVTQLVPASIPLRWERRVRRRVTVLPHFQGRTLGESSIRKPASPNPGEVEIEGPESDVLPIKSVRTEAIDVRGLGVGGHERWAQLEPLPIRCRYIGRSVARLRFEVVPVVAERLLRRLQIDLPDGQKSLRVKPAQINLELRGPNSAPQSLNREAISAYVEIPAKERIRKARLVPVQVRGIPEESVDVRVEPPLVTVYPRGGSARLPQKPSEPGKQRP